MRSLGMALGRIDDLESVCTVEIFEVTSDGNESNSIKGSKEVQEIEMGDCEQPSLVA